MAKVATLHDAVATIKPEAHVSLSGFAITRCNMAFAQEVIRQKIGHLTISQCVGAMDADLLVGAGVVDRFIYGGGSLDRFGRLANVNRAIENMSLNVEEYSSLSVAFRYLAGALGIPFIPIRSLQGSDLLKRLMDQNSSDIGTVEDPFTRNNWLVLKPLNPDVAVVQVQFADEEGNAWIMGPRWDNTEQAKASKRTIIITERIVSTEFIRRQPERTIIPGLLVSHVVEQPFGAFPTSVYREYDYDSNHIEKYVEASSTQENFNKYLDEYIYSTTDYWQFLEKVGGLKQLNNLKADLVLGY